MRGVWIHGALLVVMIVLALTTSNREAYVSTDAEWRTLWERDSVDLVSVSYTSADTRIELTRRTENGETFVWGREVGPNAGSGELSFPVGTIGTDLYSALAEFRVPRILGRISAERAEEFGFQRLTGTLAVDFLDGSRTIEVGDAVYGTDDRYARDAGTGEVFVLTASVIEPLRIGSEAVRERRLHHFLDADVARVRVESRGSVREMLRGDAEPGVRPVWFRPDGSGQRDQTFTNFMERVAQLAIFGFPPAVDPESLQVVLIIEYEGQGGESLGFTELSRASEGSYFIRSERTRIHARAFEQASARVEQDLLEIF